ncbi:tyrosine-type recombinase/integrase [Stenotrophomonas sp. CFBP8994]|uniref:tyrosine-type recombinase/integrase n=1 Tax=Stenotrophomonas sp. CFBP8994 TaxID=3096527 RepID=UPI002A6B8ECC|nr:tyrosine-type recombinase/integrase [Stenotrophomonas sp. CFBP8994]MDY0978964.1 tyrosine-type recombinase/integrase [Stenotrophomonas sp. CFBP8994]
MTPRKRSSSRQGWPDNLYPNRDGFKYRHPVTRRETFMGRDKAKAFAAAKKLNAMLMPGNDLIDRVVGSRETVADAIAVFRRDDIPNRGWAPKTAEVYESVIRRIEAGLGPKPVEDVAVKDCAEFIRAVTQSDRARQQFRLVLGWIMACAVQEGWIDTNPVLATRRFQHDRKRARLTKEMYAAIWEKADPWLRLAMDISLVTLLRRDDVVSLKFTDVRDGALWVIPQKTEGSSLVKLKIRIGEQLAGLLGQARGSVLSPYIIHRLPEKARPSNMRASARNHHTQVMPEQLTRAFQDAREAAGVTGKYPPSFHEIRSLGGALLSENGWKIEQVQGLMGHSSASMTEHYLEGHDTPWQDVQPGNTLLR